MIFGTLAAGDVRVTRKAGTLTTVVTLALSVALTTEAAIRAPEKVVGEVVDDKALVYFIRPGSMAGAARTSFVYGDGEFLGTLDNSSYMFAHLEPGTHFIVIGILGKLDSPIARTKAGQIRQSVTLEAGETYYFKAYGKLPNLGAEAGEKLRLKVKSYVTPSDNERERGPRYNAPAAPKSKRKR